MGNDPAKRYKAENEEDFFYAMDSLENFGLIHIDYDADTGNPVRYTAPYELKRIMAPFLTKEMRKYSRSLDLMSDIVTGLLYYYGAVEMDKLLKMMVAHVPGFAEGLGEMLLYVRASLSDRIRIRKIDDKVYVLRQGFMDLDLEDGIEEDKALVRMIEARSDLDYKPLTLDELFEASPEDYLENEEEYEHLKAELWDYFVYEDAGMEDIPGLPPFSEAYEIELDFEILLDDLMEEVRRTGDVAFVLESLEEVMDFPSEKARKAAYDILIRFINNLSRFELKGHTPMEIGKMGKKEKGKVIPFRKEMKFGRNDPCPCGSGKKYKNCHGRGQDPLN